MNKLFKGVHISSGNKDSVIQNSILTQLSNSVKAIQYSGVEDNGLLKEDIGEATNNFCTIIEAIFLHGLKDSLGRRFKRAIADIDERPEPSFWALLLIISHRQIIDQILHLSQITTEVGQCRAWIRLALNDCFLSSYLATLKGDLGVLKTFYRPTAYIRDMELLDVTQRLIEGVETFKTFTLPSNSSLLNSWQMPSFYLAGIWAPTLKTCPLAPCDDVAQMVEDTRLTFESNLETCSLSSAMSITSENSSLRQMVALNEDEALKIILAKHNKENYKTLEEQYDYVRKLENYEENIDLENINYNVGNSLTRNTGWSFDENKSVETVQNNKSGVTSMIHKISEPLSAEGSYDALIESHNMLRGRLKTSDLKQVTSEFECFEVVNSSLNNNVQQTDSLKHLLIKPEPISLSVLIGRISREKGLDNQKYVCAECEQALGVTNKPNVCAFTGEYFCNVCMSTIPIVIPARIIHNWDFKAYPVSQKVFNYIDEIKEHPTIDFKQFNPYIYDVVKEMAQLQILRQQLNFLRAYLYTCRGPIIEQLQKQMWPREYMYKHVDQYSISDLADIPSGALSQNLQFVINFGKEHVIGCWLCSQKGFLCELCNKSKPLFPFEIENVHRCNTCNAVYHKKCFNPSKPCPKCKRRKERTDLLFVDATVE